MSCPQSARAQSKLHRAEADLRYACRQAENSRPGALEMIERNKGLIADAQRMLEEHPVGCECHLVRAVE